LVISTSANSGLTINSGTASTGNIFFSDGTSGSEPFRGYIQYDHSSDSLRLGASGSEKARIDSSGNLLVGTTANDVGSSSSVEGITLSSGSFGGYISAARSGGTVARLNRQTSDGQILDFRKDGTTVGSIGVDNSDNLVVTGNPSHSGFMIGAETIAPYTGGALRDASEDFGSASYRWRNLYLSGGVYLGGTGSANLLDDYEEGTWTPVLRFGNATTGITYTTQSGNYVKIGNQITVSCEVQLSSKGSATGNATLGGFPVSIGLDAATATIDTVGGWSSLTVGGQTYLVATGTTGFLMSQTASSRSIIQDTQFTNSTHFFFSMTYLIS
jgi:hypothetical protein